MESSSRLLAASRKGQPAHPPPPPDQPFLRGTIKAYALVHPFPRNRRGISLSKSAHPLVRLLPIHAPNNHRAGIIPTPGLEFDSRVCSIQMSCLHAGYLEHRIGNEFLLEDAPSLSNFSIWKFAFNLLSN